MSLCLSVCLSIYLSICRLENKAILRDFFIFQSWQHQKQSNSASLPPCLNLTTSKTKQVYETSSFSKLDNIKNEAILRDFLQKRKVACSADGLVQTRFAIFPLDLSKVLRLPRKSDARPHEVLHLSRKIISAHLKIWGSKMQPLWGNQRPDLPNSCLLCCACHGKCILCPTPAIVFGNATTPSRFAHFWQGAQSLPPATRKKDISTSKSGPKPWCF